MFQFLLVFAHDQCSCSFVFVIIVSKPRAFGQFSFSLWKINSEKKKRKDFLVSTFFGFYYFFSKAKMNIVWTLWASVLYPFARQAVRWGPLIFLWTALAEYLKQDEASSEGNNQRDHTMESDKPSNENILALNDFLNRNEVHDTAAANESPSQTQSTQITPQRSQFGAHLYRKGPQPYISPGGVNDEKSPNTKNTPPTRIPGKCS